MLMNPWLSLTIWGESARAARPCGDPFHFVAGLSFSGEDMRTQWLNARRLGPWVRFATREWQGKVAGSGANMADDGAKAGLIARVQGIVLRPHQTWRAVAAEDTSVSALFARYVLILCAVNPICFTIGRLVFGERALGLIYRPPVIAAVIEGLVSYLLALAAVFMLALLIELLAPPFGGVRNRLAAFKLAAYSGTAGWLASVFYLYPPIGAVALIGVIYNLYLLYLGAEALMRTNGRRTLGYTSLVVVCYVVLMMLVISLAKLAAALA